jgi:hypothetical protein
MKNEREQKSGKSWISSFIVSAIDQALQSSRPKGQETRGGHCINLTDMIIAPLVIENIPIETLERLKVEFVKPDNGTGVAEQTDGDLYRIKETLTAEFGNEVVRRLKLSIEEENVRTLPHN